MKEQNEEIQVEVAGFSERVIAFTADYLLFAAGYLATLKALSPGDSLWASPYAAPWTAVWTVLFLIYQAVMSSGGRRSAGKALMGLRIVDLDGEPLSLAKSFLRTAGYVPSSFFAGGFLWYFANPARQTWHDLAAGSVVVAERPHPAAFRPLLRAGAAACVALFAGLWLWDHSLSRHYEDSINVAHAEVALREIDTLQGLYHAYNDRYSDSLGELAELSPAPASFLSDLEALIDIEKGVDIQLRQGGGYVVTAYARDRDGTKLRHVGG